MLLCLVMLAASPSAVASTPPELQLVAASLREGELARVEQALGPLASLPFYRADLDFDPVARSVVGRVFITVTPKGSPLDAVFLRTTPNANHEGAVKLAGLKVNGATAKLEQLEPSLHQVRFDPPAPVGVASSIELKLAARVPEAAEGSDGFDTSMSHLGEPGGDYGAFSVSAEVSCLAGIVPMLAVTGADGAPTAGPSGIGDLGTFAPSNFLVSMVVPAEFSVVASGDRVGDVPEKRGKRRFTYVVGAAREFPLLVTRGYEMAMASFDDLTVEAHFDGRDAEAGRKVLDTAVAALKTLQGKLGPIPHRRFRVVEARLSGGAGGMEFPGLVTVSTALFRGTASPLAALGLAGLQNDPLLGALMTSQLGPVLANTLEFTVDHEVVHQYFAMLVGNDPIEEPTADESLTQAVSLLVMEWQGKKALADDLRKSQLAMAYQLMRLLNHPDGRANRPTPSFSNNLEYAGLVYGKAPLLFDAQRALVGTAPFDRALKAYVEANRYQWVTAKTFTALLGAQNKAHARALEKLRRHWWDEAHGDEDLGAADLSTLLQGHGPASGAPANAPVDPAVLKEYEDALKALMGE